eukprot:scaffold39715_cov16-Tisochrysis_lutea.AAC.1
MASLVNPVNPAAKAVQIYVLCANYICHNRSAVSTVESTCLSRFINGGRFSVQVFIIKRVPFPNASHMQQAFCRLCVILKSKPARLARPEQFANASAARNESKVQSHVQF